MNDIKSDNHDVLIQRYVDICNRALDLNKDRFPFQQILCAAREAETGRLIEVDIVDSKPKVSYVMHIEKDSIVTEPHGDCDDCNCDRLWPVTLEYLKNVVHNSDAHINNPAKIDWEWMYNIPNA